MSANDSRRVVLLAREGKARDKLHQTLCEIGADLVLEADPANVDADALHAAAAQVVLIALETAIEDSLQRLDDALHGADVSLIFDDAELAAQRDGWDAQRWARHLSAKLFGHQDVLPPGREADESAHAAPTSSVLPMQLHDDVSWAQDSAPALLHGDGGMEFTGEDLSLSDEPLLLVDEPEAWQPPAHVHDAELIDDAGELHLEPESGAASEPAPSRMVEPPALPPELPAKPVSAGMNLELVEADDAPVHSPASVAPVAILPFGDIGLEPEVPDGVPAASIPAPPQAVPEPTTPESASNPATQTVQGAVLLFAGIGGPDAVRRILAELPANFPRPVLLCMRLDGGRYDNLIKQLGRVSLMPVQMALAGETAQHARVYVVPDDVSVQIDDGSARFEVGTTVQQQLIAALPAAQSSVLLLSGSDASCVGPALALAAQGAYVAGQSLQGCYDPAASKALMMRGGVIGAPSALAAGVVRHG